MNRLCSNLASTVCAISACFDVQGVGGFEDRQGSPSRTEGGTSGPETSSRRVAIALEATDWTSARTRSLRNDLAQFNAPNELDRLCNHSAAVSGSPTDMVGPVGLGPGQDIDGVELVRVLKSLCRSLKFDSRPR